MLDLKLKYQTVKNNSYCKPTYIAKAQKKNQLCATVTYVNSTKHLGPSLEFWVQTEWCGQTNVFGGG